MDTQYHALCEKLNAMGCTYCVDEPMHRHTSFQIGGPADLFAEPSDTEQAAFIFKFCFERDIPCQIIGNGTNLLIDDKGIRGVVVCMSTALSAISRQGETLVAQAGAPLSKICIFAMENGLTGLEFAYGIPGSVGGAVYMNAGAYGGEIKDVLLNVTFCDKNGVFETRENKYLDMSYRSSIFQSNEQLITSVAFVLKPGNRFEISETMKDIMSRRREKQPLEFPSAGSVFKRPHNGYASCLIDQCGLKGLRVGGAMVSTKHAGFIINTGCATCADVLLLCEKISTIVKDKTGVNLETEIKKL